MEIASWHIDTRNISRIFEMLSKTICLGSGRHKHANGAARRIVAVCRKCPFLKLTNLQSLITEISALHIGNVCAPSQWRCYPHLILEGQKVLIFRIRSWVMLLCFTICPLITSLLSLSEPASISTCYCRIRDIQKPNVSISMVQKTQCFCLKDWSQGSESWKN